MCTLIIYWSPKKLVVGANRDEVFSRPSENFKYRNNIFCPLDVLGGTWIGVNKQGVFAGLTNLDKYNIVEGKKLTRGKLVTKALQENNSTVAVNKLLASEDPLKYRGCILLIADKDNFYALTFNGSSIKSEKLDIGLHVSTGWGLDTWEVPRCEYVSNKYINGNEIKSILKYHGNFKVDSEVCVHDMTETHRTRSSCVIKSDWNVFELEYIETRPCETQEWDREKISIQK